MEFYIEIYVISNLETVSWKSRCKVAPWESYI